LPYPQTMNNVRHGSTTHGFLDQSAYLSPDYCMDSSLGVGPFLTIISRTSLVVNTAEKDLFLSPPRGQRVWVEDHFGWTMATSQSHCEIREKVSQVLTQILYRATLQSWLFSSVPAGGSKGLRGVLGSLLSPAVNWLFQTIMPKMQPNSALTFRSPQRTRSGLEIHYSYSFSILQKGA